MVGDQPSTSATSRFMVLQVQRGLDGRLGSMQLICARRQRRLTLLKRLELAAGQADCSRRRGRNRSSKRSRATGVWRDAIDQAAACFVFSPGTATAEQTRLVASQCQYEVSLSF